MNAHFPRIITLLRKEKGISQKHASTQLGISQALLSHYEKGIRECGLDFLVRCGDYYSVSCDYLLGRSPERQGSTLRVDDIPEPDSQEKENRSVGSVLPVLNKKLLANSMNILFDLLTKSKSKALIGEVSAFLMLAVYRMLRIVHAAHPKNQNAMFGLPPGIANHYAAAAMQICEANAMAICKGERGLPDIEPLKSTEALALSTDTLSQNYPLFASSLLNLVQTAEARIDCGIKPARS